MSVRVVSAPPAMRSPTSVTISVIGSGSCPSGGNSQRLKKSSVGSAMRWGRMRCMSTIHSNTLEVNDSMISGSTSRVSSRICRSDQSLIRGQSASSKPIMVAVIRQGSGAASASTTSTPPVAACSASASSTSSRTSDR